MKLTKVMDGLYRNSDCSVMVGRMPKWNSEPAHWQVRWTSLYGARNVRKFPTLAAAKAFLNDSFTFA